MGRAAGARPVPELLIGGVEAIARRTEVALPDAARIADVAAQRARVFETRRRLLELRQPNRQPDANGQSATSHTVRAWQTAVDPHTCPLMHAGSAGVTAVAEEA